MRKLTKLIAAGILFFSLAQTSFALDEGALDRARAEKAITELPDGYVKANNDKGKAIADEVNAKRKQAYEDIAKKTGTDIKAVAEQAAKKIQEKLGGK
jgi:uncharacterized protein